MRLGHLASRFFTSLRPRPLPEVDLAWLRAQLRPAELSVFLRLDAADRTEALATARRFAAAVSEGPFAGDSRWIAAALCHDVGKSVAGLGPLGRAGAATWDALRLPGRGRGRLGAHLAHARIGAELLATAGARSEVVAWARAHHDPRHWPLELVPAEVCEALALADGEPVPAPRSPALR